MSRAGSRLQEWVLLWSFSLVYHLTCLLGLLHLSTGWTRAHIVLVWVSNSILHELHWRCCTGAVWFSCRSFSSGLLPKRPPLCPFSTRWTTKPSMLSLAWLMALPMLSCTQLYLSSGNLTGKMRTAPLPSSQGCRSAFCLCRNRPVKFWSRTKATSAENNYAKLKPELQADMLTGVPQLAVIVGKGIGVTLTP